MQSRQAHKLQMHPSILKCLAVAPDQSEAGFALGNIAHQLFVQLLHAFSWKWPFITPRPHVKSHLVAKRATHTCKKDASGKASQTGLHQTGLHAQVSTLLNSLLRVTSRRIANPLLLPWHVLQPAANVEAPCAQQQMICLIESGSSRPYQKCFCSHAKCSSMHLIWQLACEW